MMYNFTTYSETYNSAIDHCANLIGCARKHMRPVKALHLSPAYYEWFKGGVEILMGRELIEGELLQFDGVNIEKGTRFQSKPVVMEYYE